MKQETLKKYIGKTWGVLTCLGIDHEDYDKERQIKRTYFKVKCSRCGSESIVRADRFFGKYIPKSCTYCVNDLQVETANKKYPKNRRLLNSKISKYTHISNRKGKTVKSYLSKIEAEKLLTSKCFYCGKENAMGIDRIDSSKDYTLDNCVPCCGMCNIMKNKFDINEWFSKIGEIYRNHVDRCSTTILKESTSQVNGDGSAELLTAKQVKEDDIVYSAQ